jgi:uncharacterized membrane protein YdfJ with MMPL/SSD domain
MVLLIGLITFALLARAFRSLLLQLKAVLLNMLSVGAALGVMVLIWQAVYGSQAIWGIKSTDTISSTQSSCACCWCRRWSLSSAAGTGGFPACPPASCA